MAELLSFLILISAGLFLSELLRKFHLPYVIALIGAGVIIGPFGLSIFQPGETMEFIGNIGLIFLMFMAGLEIRLSTLVKMKGRIAKISLLNGAIPFFLGFAIASLFGYDFIASVLVGIIFISSSIAVVIPSLESRGLLHTGIGKAIIGSTVIEDVASLVLLSVVLQMLQPSTNLPLPIYYFIIIASMIVLRSAIPTIRNLFLKNAKGEKDLFEQEIRLVFAILIGVVIFFEILGMHSIIAGFFTGLVLSESIKSEFLKKKLHAISYGLFIPVFFVLVGTKTDLGALASAWDSILLAAAITAGSILAKFISGMVAGRLTGFGRNESALIGAATIPQLSTTLAVVFVGLDFGLLDNQMVAAMVTLSALTTFAAPMLISLFVDKIEIQKEERKRNLMEGKKKKEEEKLGKEMENVSLRKRKT